jgi:hypothetical protein
VTRVVDKVMDVATRLVEARAAVAQLEAELEALVGEGGAKPAKKEPERASKAAGGRKPSGVHDQIVAMARDGLDRVAINKKLGPTGPGLVAVANHLFRARKAGELPALERSNGAHPSPKAGAA